MSSLTPFASDPLWGEARRPPASLSLRVEAADASQVGEARREVSAFARTLGFGEEDAGRVALVATEAATNVVRHGGGGVLVARALPGHASGLETGLETGLELLALDRGPGIPDLPRALVDGYSTGGTAGAGLGAMRRMSDVFDVHGAPGHGTAVLLRLYPARVGVAPRDDADFGAVCLPTAGEQACGDAWARFGSGDAERLIVVDGLGHGPLAAEAAAAALDAAERVFTARPQAAPAEAMQAVHLALRATRGAAVAIVALDRAAGRIRFAGVGNIAGSIVPTTGEPGTRSQSMVSHNGTVGHAMRKVQEFEYAWPAEALVVLHSDGLATQWRLEERPGLARRDAALVAGVLYRDWTRGRDDVTVLVTRRASPDLA